MEGEVAEVTRALTVAQSELLAAQAEVTALTLAAEQRSAAEVSAAQESYVQLAASQRRVTELEGLNLAAAQQSEAATGRSIALLAELTVSRAGLAVADAMGTGLTAEVTQLTADMARLTTSTEASLREKEQAQEASIELGATVADLRAELAAAQEAAAAGAQLASLDLAAAEVRIASLEEVGAFPL